MKKYILWIIALLLVLIALYFYSEYNRKPVSAVDAKAHIVSAEELMKQFLANDSLADEQYKNDVIELNGMVSSVEKNTATVLVFSKEGASVRCTFEDIIPINDSLRVTVKGFYIGYNKDELLGTDIMLNRCVLLK